MSSLRVVVASAAPRVSTHPETESLGPRSHLLGVINGFDATGAQVDTLIVGDMRVFARFGRPGSERQLSSGARTLLSADVLRLLVRWAAAWCAAVKVRGSRDVVYERYGLYQALGRTIRRTTGATWVLEVNALLADEATGSRRATTSRRLAKLAERRTLHSCDQIVAVSVDLARAIRAEYGIAADKIIVVPNGVDCSRFTQTPPPRRAGVRPVRIGFVGALYPWQNVDVLFDAVLTQTRPVEVVVAGDGPMLELLRQHPAVATGRAELRGRVHPDDVPELLGTFDVCYAGHRADDSVYFSPLKVWEYLAAGRPALVSDQAKMRELAGDGFAVFPFRPGTLSDVLTELLDDLDVAQSTAWQRRGQVCELHSWASRMGDLSGRLIRPSGARVA